MTVDAEVTPIVVKSIMALASVCDRAQARDRAGFSKATAGPGHEIAALGPGRWPDAVWDYAARLSAHHGKQLLKAGVLDDQDVELLQTWAHGGHASPEIKSNWLDVDVIDGQEMLIASVAGKGDFTDMLKRLPIADVYQPAGGGRLWRVSSKYAFAFEQYTKHYELLKPEVLDFIRSSSTKATADDRLNTHLGPVFDLGEDGTFVSFTGPFHADLRDHIRENEYAWFEKPGSWNNVIYKARLNAEGVKFVDLVLSGFGGLATARAREAIEKARTVRPSTIPPEAIQIAMERVMGRIHIRLSYFNKDIVGAIKQLDDRKFVKDGWSVPAYSSVFMRLSKICEETPGAIYLKGPVDRMAEVLVRQEADNKSASAPSYPSLRLETADDGQTVAVHLSQYVEEWVTALKSLPIDKRKYDGKCWRVENSARVFDYLVRHTTRSMEAKENLRWQAAGINELKAHLSSFAYQQTEEPSSAPRP